LFIYLSLIESEDEKHKFESLYHAYHKLMLYIAYQILENQQDAEDAVHDACLRLVALIEKINDPVCPQTQALVSIVVRGKAIDLYRKRTRRKTVSLEYADHLLFLPEKTPDKQTEHSDGFLRAIAALSERERDLLLLRYDHGFTPREIARLMSLTESGVKKALQRARARLKQNLEEQGVEI